MSPIQKPALGSREEASNQIDFIQRISNNWKHRNISIIVSGSFTLLASAGIVAASVLTSGIVAIAIASSALILGALAMISLIYYSPQSETTLPQMVNEGRLEKTKPTVETRQTDLIEPKGHVLQRRQPRDLTSNTDKEPKVFSVLRSVAPHSQLPQTSIEHPVSNMGHPSVGEDLGRFTDDPTFYEVREERSSYPWKTIAGLVGVMGLGAAALIYFYNLPTPILNPPINKFKEGLTLCQDILLKDVKIDKKTLKEEARLGFYADRDERELSCFLNKSDLQESCQATCIQEILRKFRYTDRNLMNKEFSPDNPWAWLWIPQERFSENFKKSFPGHMENLSNNDFYDSLGKRTLIRFAPPI